MGMLPSLASVHDATPETRLERVYAAFALGRIPPSKIQGILFL